MNKLFYSIFLFAFIVGVLGFLPTHVFANPIVRISEDVSVGKNSILEGDFYGLGSSITISGSAQDDVYVVGGVVTINGDILGDLTVIGGSVQIHGEVKDDVRILGGDVSIAKPVGGDVVVIGGNVDILSTATVGGDFLFAGHKAEIDGEVSGSVYGTVAILNINARVGGDVSVTTDQQLTLRDEAEVQGNITYKSFLDIVRAQNAVVSGTIRKEKVEAITIAHEAQLIVIQLLILLFAVLSLFLLIRAPLERLVARTVSSFGKQGIIGLGVLIGMPLVGALLTVSVIGSIVGIVILIAYVLLLFIAWIVSGIVLGSLVKRALHKGERITLLTVVGGTILFGLMIFLPFIGPILTIAFVVVVLGGISMALYRFLR